MGILTAQITVLLRLLWLRLVGVLVFLPGFPSSKSFWGILEGWGHVPHICCGGLLNLGLGPML